MEFVIATNNRKKLEEIGRILAALGHSGISLAAAGVAAEPPENGTTFAENAMIKAAAAHKATGKPCLADDSGLVVDALGGEPGIHSARFAGTHGDDEANNKRLLYLLERTPYAARSARFVCAMALVMPGGAALETEGVCEGRIGFAPSGTRGFGYDPLFYVGEKSFADITDDEKDKISHRARALQKLAEELPGFLAQQGAAAPDAPQEAAPADTLEASLPIGAEELPE